MSGKDNKEQQPQNNPFISFALLVFHFDISGNNFNEEQSLKIHPK